MASSEKVVNTLYCLAKVNGKWEVCRFSQGNIIFFGGDGSEAVKVCAKKDKTRWKYFTEACIIHGREGHVAGGKVILPDEKGRPKHFYVVDVGNPDAEGVVEYLIAR